MVNLSKIQQEILTYYFTNPRKSHYLRELAEILACDPGNLSKALTDLVSRNFLLVEERGNLKIFTVNIKHPLYKDLKQLFFKTSGVAGALKKELTGFKNIAQAFIFGSFAKNAADEYSDIDLMIIGKINEDRLIEKISSLEKKFQREINYIIFTPQEFAKKSSDSFLKKIMAGKKIILIDQGNR